MILCRLNRCRMLVIDVNAALVCYAFSFILLHLITAHLQIKYTTRTSTSVYIFHWSRHRQSDCVYIHQIKHSVMFLNQLSGSCGTPRYLSNGQVSLWSGSHPTCTRRSTLCHVISFTYRLLTYQKCYNFFNIHPISVHFLKTKFALVIEDL